MASTKIEWAQEVWNPVRGCTKVSRGCEHCYAERLYHRFWKGQNFRDVKTFPARLQDPSHWKKPRRVFVNSMSDLFHEKVPVEFIANVFAVMQVEYRHTYMILTKRPGRMLSVLSGEEFAREYGQALDVLSEHTFTHALPLDNVWLGVSAEDQKTADERIPLLLSTPAAVRFVSVEPMLGPVDLRSYMNSWQPMPWPTMAYPKFHWVICGGESGPGARPMNPAWARALRDQCKAASVPFFFKQWGEWYPSEQGSVPRVQPGTEVWHWEYPDVSLRIGKVRAGRLLDGREWNEFPKGSETEGHPCQ